MADQPAACDWCEARPAVTKIDLDALDGHPGRRDELCRECYLSVIRLIQHQGDDDASP